MPTVNGSLMRLQPTPTARLEAYAKRLEISRQATDDAAGSVALMEHGSAEENAVSGPHGEDRGRRTLGRVWGCPSRQLWP